jgi:hypothetical protein
MTTKWAQLAVLVLLCKITLQHSKGDARVAATTVIITCDIVLFKSVCFWPSCGSYGLEGIIVSSASTHFR